MQNKENKEYNIETKIINLSTKSSVCTLLNGSKKSNVSYDLNNLINFQNDNTIEKVMVSMPYCIVPNSCYNINEYNNNLKVLYSSSSYLDIYFPYGNYTYQTFITTFKQLLPSIFNITYNSLTNKFTITNDDYPFWFQESENSIDYIMGFDNEIFSTNSPPYKIDMPRCVNFLPPPVFNICSNQIFNGTNLNYSNILCSVVNNARLGAENVVVLPLEEFELKNLTTNTIFNIQILDDEGRFLDFNGISTYFSLKFKIFKKNTKIEGSFYDILKNSTNQRYLQEN